MNTQKLTFTKVGEYLERMRVVHKEWNDVCQLAGDDALETLKDLKGVMLELPDGLARIVDLDFYCHADGGQIYLYLIYKDAMEGKHDKELSRSELQEFRRVMNGKADIREFANEVDEDVAARLVETIRISVDWTWIIALLDAEKISAKVVNKQLTFNINN